MAEPISPEIWTLVFGGVGTAIAAFAVRMGWKGGTKELNTPTDAVEIKNAIVDSSSMKILSASIEGLGFNLLELKKVAIQNDEKNVKLTEKLIEAMEAQTEELRRLGREIRDHASEVSKSK